MTQEIVVQAENKSLLDIVARAAMDPNVDPQKMNALLDIQERIMNKQAEIEFNKALIRAQKNMPRVKKDGELKNKAGQTVAKYMRFEDIDDKIRVVYEAEGFSIVDSQKENENGTVTIFTTVIHEAGHSMTVQITVPKDKENGLKTALQAAVSTVSVGRRINICNIFRIVGTDEACGDGASNIPFITADQASEIMNLINETGTDTRKMLETMTKGAVSISEIIRTDYERIKNALLIKKSRMESQNDIS